MRRGIRISVYETFITKEETRGWLHHDDGDVEMMMMKMSSFLSWVSGPGVALS